ncbi:8651_t:CDS:1, partial [Racocetra fulgida]
NILEYAKKATDEDPKPSFSFDFKYVYKKDGTRIPIPKKLFCGEKCVNSIIKTYKSWTKHYKLSPKVIENVFGSEDEFDDYLDCKTDDKRDTRTSGSCLSPLHSSLFYN